MDDETPEEVPPDSQIVSQIGRRAARGGPGAPPPRRPPPPPPEVSPWSQGAYLKAQRAPGLHFDSDESDSEDEAAAAAATVALMKTAGGAKTSSDDDPQTRGLRATATATPPRAADADVADAAADAAAAMAAARPTRRSTRAATVAATRSQPPAVPPPPTTRGGGDDSRRAKSTADMLASMFSPPKTRSRARAGGGGAAEAAPVARQHGPKRGAAAAAAPPATAAGGAAASEKEKEKPPSAIARRTRSRGGGAAAAAVVAAAPKKKASTKSAGMLDSQVFPDDSRETRGGIFGAFGRVAGWVMRGGASELVEREPSATRPSEDVQPTAEAEDDTDAGALLADMTSPRFGATALKARRETYLRAKETQAAAAAAAPPAARDKVNDEREVEEEGEAVEDGDGDGAFALFPGMTLGAAADVAAAEAATTPDDLFARGVRPASAFFEGGAGTAGAGARATATAVDVEGTEEDAAAPESIAPTQDAAEGDGETDDDDDDDARGVEQTLRSSIDQTLPPNPLAAAIVEARFSTERKRRRPRESVAAAAAATTTDDGGDDDDGDVAVQTLPPNPLAAALVEARFSTERKKRPRETPRETPPAGARSAPPRGIAALVDADDVDDDAARGGLRRRRKATAPAKSVPYEPPQSPLEPAAAATLRMLDSPMGSALKARVEAAQAAECAREAAAAVVMEATRELEESEESDRALKEAAITLTARTAAATTRDADMAAFDDVAAADDEEDDDEEEMPLYANVFETLGIRSSVKKTPAALRAGQKPFGSGPSRLEGRRLRPSFDTPAAAGGNGEKATPRRSVLAWLGIESQE